MMFVFLFPVFLLRVACRCVRAWLAAAGLTALHAFALLAAPRAHLAPATGAGRPSKHTVRNAAQTATRAALRAIHAGHSLTPTGYTLLGAAFAVAALVSLLCVPAGTDAECPLRPRLQFA
jgi:hypothetical protein